jgi:hypothetical protein
LRALTVVVKRGKWIAILLVALPVVVAVLAAAALYLPPVQRWLLLYAIDPAPEDRLTIQDARIGWTHTSISGFEWAKPKATYRFNELEGNISVLDVLLRQRLQVDTLRVSGLEIDLTGYWEERPEPEPFEGVLQELNLPEDFTLGEFAVDGHVLFQALDGRKFIAQIRATGGDIAAGSEGWIEMGAVVDDFESELLPQPIHLRTEGLVRIEADGQISRLNLGAEIQRYSERAAELDPLLVEFDVRQDDTREEYAASITSAKASETRETLLRFAGSFRPAERMFESRWEINLQDDDIRPVSPLANLPSFLLRGKGELTADMENEHYAARLELDGTMHDLEQMSPRFQYAPPLWFQLNMETSVAEEWLEVVRLEAALGSLEDDGVLLQGRTFTGLRFHTETWAFDSGNGRRELGELAAYGLPTEWAIPALALIDKKLEVQNGTVNGAILLTETKGGLSARTVEPLTAGPATFFLQNEPVLREAFAVVSGEAFFDEGQILATVESLRLDLNDTMAIEGSGKFDHAEGELRLRGETNVPAVLDQTGLLEEHRFVSGILTIEADISFRERLMVQATAVLNEASVYNADTEKEAVPPIFLELVASQEGEGQWEFKAPLRIEKPGASGDVVLSGKWNWMNADHHFDLVLTGEHLFLDDLMTIVGALGYEDPDLPDADDRHEEPIWSGLQGRLDVDLVSLQLFDGLSIESIVGEIGVEDDGLRAELEGVFLGSPIYTVATVVFDENAARPYRLQGEVDAMGIAFGALLQNFVPHRPPLVEGILTVSTSAQSEGYTPGDLAYRLQGAMLFTGNEGVFRLFYTDNPRAGIGLALGGILGLLGGELGTIGRIAEELGEIEFDRIEALFMRDRELRLRMDDLIVLSPEFHITGNGIVLYEEDVGFTDQPVELNFTLAVRGEAEDLIERSNILSNERDYLDYRKFQTDFTIDGTLADLDLSPFFGMLADAALGLALPFSGRIDEPDDEAQRQEEAQAPE